MLLDDIKIIKQNKPIIKKSNYLLNKPIIKKSNYLLNKSQPMEKRAFPAAVAAVPLLNIMAAHPFLSSFIGLSSLTGAGFGLNKLYNKFFTDESKYDGYTPEQLKKSELNRQNRNMNILLGGVLGGVSGGIFGPDLFPNKNISDARLVGALTGAGTGASAGYLLSKNEI